MHRSFLALRLSFYIWLQAAYGKPRTASGILLGTMNCLNLHLFLFNFLSLSHL